jgi:hypothetical protein
LDEVKVIHLLTRCFGDAELISVQEGAVSPFGREELIQHGIKDERQLRPTRRPQSDADANLQAQQ